MPRFGNGWWELKKKNIGDRIHNRKDILEKLRDMEDSEI